MLTFATRQIMPEERAITATWEVNTRPDLARAGFDGCGTLFWGFIAFVAGQFAGALALIFLFPATGRLASLPSALFIGGLIGVSVYLLCRVLSIFWQNYVLTANQEVEQVEVVHATATGAVLVRSETDANYVPGYALQVDTHTLLLISDLDVAKLVHAGQFPCQRFEVVRAIPYDTIIRIIPLGPPLAIDFTHFLLPLETFPQEIEIIEGSLDDLSPVLQKLAAHNAATVPGATRN